MDREKERLKKLVAHWAEHNDEHMSRFKESAEDAAEMGLDEVSARLEEAYERGRVISKILRECFEFF